MKTTNFSTGENKYSLQIRPNFYKKLDQLTGNGGYKEYVEGCFKSGKVFLIYEFENIFYLYTGKNKNELELTDRINLTASDKRGNAILKPVVYMKYVNTLLDNYMKKENENI